MATCLHGRIGPDAAAADLRERFLFSGAQKSRLLHGNNVFARESSSRKPYQGVSGGGTKRFAKFFVVSRTWCVCVCVLCIVRSPHLRSLFLIRHGRRGAHDLCF